MNNFDKVVLRERIMKLEISSAAIALFFSLFFVFSCSISELHQIYYPFIIFLIHQGIIFSLYASELLEPKFRTYTSWLKVICCVGIIIGMYKIFGRFLNVNGNL